MGVEVGSYHIVCRDDFEAIDARGNQLDVVKNISM